MSDLAGYALRKRRIDNEEVGLLLPGLVKYQIERDEEQQRLELEARIQEERRAEREKQARSEAAAHVHNAGIPESPPARPRRCVAVFDWTAARERVRSLASNPGTGDLDLVKRDRRQLEKAMERGPWRLVGPALDWKSSLSTLAEEMPNFEPVVTFVAQRLALASLAKSPLRPPPLLLLGEPGVGKTFFAERLAKILGTEVFRHSFDNLQATGGLRGSDRHWGNTSTGALWDLIMLGKRADPIVLLDELDKAKTEGSGYRPADELLTLLEPASAICVKDNSMNFEFDTSYVWYVATANYAEQISAPIRSRFTEFRIEVPDIDGRLVLANGIYAATLARLVPSKRLRARFAPPTNLQMCRLAWLTPRQIRKVSERVIAAAALADRWHLEDSDFDTALKPVDQSSSLVRRDRDDGEPFAAVIVGIR